MATPLLDAFSKINADKALATRFTKEPDAVLIELGVETEGLIIQKAKEGSMLTTNTTAASRLTVCASLGYIVCASAGDQIR